MALFKYVAYRVSGVSSRLPQDLTVFEEGGCSVHLTADPGVVQLIQKKGAAGASLLSAGAEVVPDEVRPGLFLVYSHRLGEFDLPAIRENQGLDIGFMPDGLSIPDHDPVCDIAIAKLAIALDLDDPRIEYAGSVIADREREARPLILFRVEMGAAELHIASGFPDGSRERLAKIRDSDLPELSTRLLGAAERSRSDPAVSFMLAWGAAETFVTTIYKKAYQDNIRRNAEPRYQALREMEKENWALWVEERAMDLPLQAKLRVIMKDRAGDAGVELAKEFSRIGRVRNDAFHGGGAALLNGAHSAVRLCVRRMFLAAAWPQGD